MSYFRLVAQVTAQMVLKQTVGIRYSPMLAKVLNPGFDKKGLDEPPPVGSVFENSPSIGPIALPFLSDLVNCHEERVPIFGFNPIFDRHHDRPGVFLDRLRDDWILATGWRA